MNFIVFQNLAIHLPKVIKIRQNLLSWLSPVMAITSKELNLHFQCDIEICIFEDLTLRLTFNASGHALTC